MDQSLRDAAGQGSIDAVYQSFRDAAEQGIIDALYQSFKAAEQRRTDVLCQSLRDAAKHGSIDALYALIRRDAEVLDSTDKIPFVETPLHIAASLGHTQFAMEIMKLRPSFARKLNQDGFSPMHLALQKLHDSQNDPALQRNLTQLVHRLLDVDKDLVRVQGKEGVTPLHYVAQTGNLDFLAKFFKVCPKSLEDVTIRRDNVLHIALKYDMVEAFWLPLRFIRRSWFKEAKLLEEKLLNCRDEEDNTLLHVAVSKNQPEVVSWLLKRGFADLKGKNLEGDTVFDISERQTQTQVDNNRIRDMLQPHLVRQRRSKRFTSIIAKSNLRHHISGLEKCCVGIRRQQTGITDERRNALLVVAALLITVTYQAALGPDRPPNQYNCTAPINATGASHFNCTARFDASSDVKYNSTELDLIFYSFNTLTYFLTNITLGFLVPHDFIGFVLTLLSVFLFCCYCVSSPLLSNAPIISSVGMFAGLVLFELLNSTFIILFEE